MCTINGVSEEKSRQNIAADSAGNSSVFKSKLKFSYDLYMRQCVTPICLGLETFCYPQCIQQNFVLFCLYYVHKTDTVKKQMSTFSIQTQNSNQHESGAHNTIHTYICKYTTKIAQKCTYIHKTERQTI